ncbi:MAG: hypothetical protein Q8Q88_08970 [Phenylobacterium sp.]|uniref:hypothetical protein n=1 Tax=Phenylobacterium sp. TaxID=1871053 RepID=UPI0027326D43|nr:hypothetical protein [Phenylobacterium sp.]MDP3747164.1 hypothetical protein [Phenylobacterium sp.]
MKTAQADFRFPVLGFTTDSDVWGLSDLDALATCGPPTLAEGLQVRMELVDAEGRRWIVNSVLHTGRAGSLLSRLMPGPAPLRIEHELELLAPLSLTDVQARVCEAMRAHPDFWCEDEERDTILPARLAEVTAAAAIADIHEVLGLDSFHAY